MRNLGHQPLRPLGWEGWHQREVTRTRAFVGPPCSPVIPKAGRKGKLLLGPAGGPWEFYIPQSQKEQKEILLKVGLSQI